MLVGDTCPSYTLSNECCVLARCLPWQFREKPRLGSSERKIDRCTHLAQPELIVHPTANFVRVVGLMAKPVTLAQEQHKFETGRVGFAGDVFVARVHIVGLEFAVGTLGNDGF